MMNASWFDLFFSASGRVDRRTWGLSVAGLIVAASFGVCLFNDGSFDESANAVSAAPTMAAFLWVAVAAFCATVLSLKRLSDAGRSRAFGYAMAAALAVLVVGWGVGMFATPWVVGGQTVLFWGLVLTGVPGLLICAMAPRAV